MGCPLIHQLSCVCHVNLYICKDTWEWHNLTPMKLPIILHLVLCNVLESTSLQVFVLVIKIWLMFYCFLIIYSLRNLQNKTSGTFLIFFLFAFFFSMLDMLEAKCHWQLKYSIYHALWSLHFLFLFPFLKHTFPSEVHVLMQALHYATDTENIFCS